MRINSCSLDSRKWKMHWQGRHLFLSDLWCRPWQGVWRQAGRTEEMVRWCL